MSKDWDWLNANKLTFNVKKSNFVIFHPKGRRVNQQVEIKLTDNNTNSSTYFEQKEYVKYLGILIDNHLTWKPYIDYVTTKISKAIGVIARLRHLVPQSTLLNLYRSLIFPYLSYGLIAWGQGSKSNLNKVLMLQKRVIRLVHFLPYRDHSLPIFVSSNILPIELLYFETVSVFMHDGSNDTAPENLCDAFTRPDKYTHITPDQPLREFFYVKPSRLNLMRNSVARFGTFLWNSLRHYVIYIVLSGY